MGRHSLTLCVSARACVCVCLSFTISGRRSERRMLNSKTVQGLHLHYTCTEAHIPALPLVALQKLCSCVHSRPRLASPMIVMGLSECLQFLTRAAVWLIRRRKWVINTNFLLHNLRVLSCVFTASNVLEQSHFYQERTVS